MCDECWQAAGQRHGGTPRFNFNSLALPRVAGDNFYTIEEGPLYYRLGP